ncbi:MAG: cell division protein [Alphaproteobacteria bacterium]|nr:cell division protein [Alphaproteobacteria bacterium]
MIFRKNAELPFAKDSLAWFLPWMVMLMVFFATLTTAATMTLNSMLSKWTDSVSGSLTVQILPIEDENGIDKRRTQIETEEALAILRKTAGVKSANLLTDRQMKDLLKPWLGDSVEYEDLPMPALIDVQLMKNVSVNLDTLRQNLREGVPNATLDIHKKWLNKLIELISRLDDLGSIMLLLVILTTSAIVIYVSCTSMAVHKPIIELLHLIGAQDSYIAEQYAIRTAILSSVGGMIGFFLAIPILYKISSIVREIQGGLLVSAQFDTLGWLALICVPFLAIVLSVITSYWAVHRTLKKML